MKTKILLLFLTVSTISAQETKLTLKNSLDLGLFSSKEIQISNSSVKIAEEKVVAANSMLLPKLSIGLNLNYLSDLPFQFNIPIPTGTQSQGDQSMSLYYANASIEQPIFTGLRLLSLKYAAEYNKEAALIENSKALNDKAFSIHLAFWNYYKMKNVVAAIEENLVSLENHLKDTENFFDNGLATLNDLLKLKVRVADIKLKLIDAENNLSTVHAYFNKSIGKNLTNTTEIVSDDIVCAPETKDYVALLTEAFSLREELMAHKYKLQAADEMITAANSTWFPQLSAFGSYNLLQIDSDGGMIKNDLNNFWMVGLGLKWSVWDWWNTSSKSSQAKQQYYQLELSKEIIKDKIEMEVYKNYLNLQSEEGKVEVGQLRVESAEENYRITKEKYNSQLVTSTELIDADSAISDAKMKLIISLVDYKLALVILEKSLGRKIY